MGSLPALLPPWCRRDPDFAPTDRTSTPSRPTERIPARERLFPRFHFHLVSSRSAGRMTSAVSGAIGIREGTLSRDCDFLSMIMFDGLGSRCATMSRIVAPYGLVHSETPCLAGRPLLDISIGLDGTLFSNDDRTGHGGVVGDLSRNARPYRLYGGIVPRGLRMQRKPESSKKRRLVHL